MTRLFFISFLAASVTFAVTTPARAQSLTARAHASETRVARFATYLQRLETQLQEQGKRIARLKHQRPGVGRDLQLKAALRTTQQLATRLTRLRTRLRDLRAGLLGIYRQAINDAKSAAAKRAWHARRRTLRSTMRHRQTRLVTGARANPLDSAEDLEEKADLLTDSAAKVRRRLARLSRRISRIERQTKLRRHGRAAVETPFVEDTTRRLAGTRRAATGTPTANAPKAPAPQEGPPAPKVGGSGTPPPPSLLGGSAPGSNSDPNHDETGREAQDGSYGSHGESTLVPVPSAPDLAGPGRATPTSPSTLNRGLDPETLSALAATRKGSPASRLAALRRARASLNRLASTLGARAKALRKQAKRRSPKRKGTSK
ncbi:MAG: hypothetical protein KAI47_05630 [Deltaproteobacteria bacterium]|nr:hypothetical protein [Deltaproteobacteria bacterium]